MHRTPFSRLHDHLPPAKQKYELKRYLTALYRQRDPRLRYGLDVWLYRRKVLDLAWDGDIVPQQNSIPIAGGKTQKINVED